MVNAALFWGATIVYVAITLLLAYYGWKKTKKGEDFLIAGRKVNPWIIGLSYGATFISTSAIVGFGGIAALYGEGIIWLVVLNISVGILIAFAVFGKPTRRLGQKLKALTFPDLLGKIYKSPFLQYATAFLILVSMPLYSSAVLIGGSRFIETTLNINYNYALLAFAIITAAYVLFGGLLAVMYTDAFQGAIMIFGMSAILVLTYVGLGGVVHANQALTDLATNPGVQTSLASQGMTGWTTFPSLGTPLWLTFVTTIIMGVGIGVLAQPQLVVRFMTAKDSKSLNRAIPIGGVFILLTTGVAYTVGALTNVYFWVDRHLLSWGPPGSTGVGVTSNTDLIVPKYIEASMPDIIIVIFLLTLLAAAMSTLSSIFHTMGSAAGFDIWQNLKMSRLMPKNRRKAKCDKLECSLTANRIGTLIMIVASVLLAFAMPPSIIARATAMFMGLCASAFLPMFTMALFVKRPSMLGAKMSLIVGAIVWFFWTAFVHIKESSALGLCQAIFGKPALLPLPWQNVDPLIIALPCSIAALLIGWYIESRKWASEGSGAQTA